ncbi:hypothetical protein [Amycolatopsis viridis]|uniref:Spore-associated protein A n=1 Tax=Amycolatopsis viridis TaxID=185678 RepID=A0ABX0SN70_9PSEU|nr:hypothetical protein [Amycolatopsis viridis]NIH78417.1 hypothetical protein [Amycolatopsis viridis]
MKRLVLSLLVPVLAAMAMIVGGGTASAAGNPYTAASACAHDFGGSWHQTKTRGHYAIKDRDKRHVGDVYLMYNSATGNNCVVTLKSIYVGKPTGISVLLEVQGRGYKYDDRNYKYYNAVQAFARDRCVKYHGGIAMDAGYWAIAGPNTEWGNCH